MTAPAVCLIDASIYIFRYYFALPESRFSEREGHSTDAVYGFTGFLLQLLERHRPERLAVCFDESLETGFRHQLYPLYKSSRALPDAALEFQLKACAEAAQLLGLATFASTRYEADDLIGSLYLSCCAEPTAIAILSRDKDLAQLLAREQDCFWDYSADVRYQHDDITIKYGVMPAQIVDYLALVGDAGDDIPGVPGIGAKTAIALLRYFGSLDALFARLDEVAQVPVRGARTLAAKILAAQEQIKLAQQLATIVQDIPLLEHPKQLQRSAVKLDQFSAFSRAMGWTDALAQRARKINPQQD
ncbi:5'-3' exonuclease [Gilvimarinus polysaccharolyticus]|uniref:5'-3' exonuclease n=1 Tax=Gilvimarinus polysaccharolyticus TaxID=863921 RepID=UPI000673ACC6|nr:5'-3' exonuclease [Gilvimarinus polysaccharolyticus]